jgi:hypothetical protein
MMRTGSMRMSTDDQSLAIGRDADARPRRGRLFGRIRSELLLSPLSEDVHGKRRPQPRAARPACARMARPSANGVA